MGLFSRRSQSAERRDPSGATQLARYQTPGTPMVPEWQGEQAIRNGFYSHVFVYACIRRMAQDVASCPFVAGPDPNKRAQRAPSSPLARLLGPPPGSPNPTITAKSLMANAVAQYLVTGKLAWELETDTGKPDGQIVRIWPLVASQLQAIPSDGGMSYFGRFKYGTPGKERPLQPWQVFYAWRPSLHDYRQPESALQAARLEISASIMQSRYDLAFLRNDARPASVVVHEAFAEQDDRLGFQQQFLASHQGPDNAGKPMFVEAQNSQGNVTGAIDIKTLGLSQRDSQALQANQARIQRICVGLGVPMSMLDASGRTFNNGNVEVRNYWEGTVFGIMGELEGAINTQLAPRLGSDVGWFDYDHIGALKPPTKFQPVSPVDLVDEEIVLRDEVRDELGLSPLDEDTAASWTPAGKLLKQAQAAQALIVAGFDPSSVLMTVGLPDMAVKGAPALPVPDVVPARVVEVEARDTAVDDPAERRAKQWRSADAQVRSLESTWAKSFRRIFARQKVATIARLKGKRGRQMLTELRAEGDNLTPDPSTVFDTAFWSADTEDIATGLYDSVFAVGGARVSDKFGVSFDVEAPYAQDFIRERAHQLAGEVTDTTYDAIRQAMIDGMTAQNDEGFPAGEGIDDIAARITDVFDAADGTRAKLIARTEVISAYNASGQLAAEQLPADVVGGKEWIAEIDGRTRDTHVTADGQVVSLHDPFVVGSSHMQYPGDPAGGVEEVANCRCTIGHLTPEEYQSHHRSDNRIEMRVALRVLQGVADKRIGIDAATAAMELAI